MKLSANMIKAINSISSLEEMNDVIELITLLLLYVNRDLLLGYMAWHVLLVVKEQELLLVHALIILVW